MTAHDERSNGGHAPMEGSTQSSSQFVAYETDDGDIVIRDEDDGDAWIRSDTVVDLASDE